MLLWMISYATAQESLPCRGTATTVLNVRSGPGISYARVGQLSRGQEVNVIQKSSNNWVQIEFGSQRGYAYSKYLKFSPLPQKANSPPAKSSSGSSSWSFWSIVWNIITWGLGIYLGLVVLYWLLKILIKDVRKTLQTGSFYDQPPIISHLSFIIETKNIKMAGVKD
jgi:hypothetical protein